MTFARLLCSLASFLARVRVGADPRRCPPGTIVLLPGGGALLRCGIAALVEVVRAPAAPSDPARAERDVAAVEASGIDRLAEASDAVRRASHAGGAEGLERLAAWARSLKRSRDFAAIVLDPAARARAAGLAERLRRWADAEDARLQAAAVRLADDELEVLSARVLQVRDVAWSVEREALPMADEVRDLCGPAPPAPRLLVQVRRLVSVLRSIDRIEIRGRDSAGVAVQVAFEDRAAFDAFLAAADRAGLAAELDRRGRLPDLAQTSIAVSDGVASGARPAVTFVYKVAAEVGRLGDNVAELRRQARADAILPLALASERAHAVVLGHTRWASSGVISIQNCHPVDNGSHARADGDDAPASRSGRIFVVLNGDVDNHLEIRDRWEAETGRCVSPRITTDTKVIALEIDRQLAAGHPLEDAFRRAVAGFAGSCAIGMVTDLEPGRLFLSLRGSGQSLYVGLADDGWFAASEVYGVVEEGVRYVKLDGEKDRVPGSAATRGQVVTVSAFAGRDDGGTGVRRLGFDGVVLPVADADVRRAEITTRDVDRGDFEHFFRKEITQSPRSVARTLWGRVVTGPDGRRALSPRVLTDRVRTLLTSGKVRQVLVVGQGTAAVAGWGIAEYLRALTRGSALRAHALPATELSGFHLADDMSDTVVVAVTQSGSTADTNRALDLARRRGAHVVAVVNRRNSDITYRADGVVYTSDGRDVEMSVASTKAFYSQLTAGALLSLAIAEAVGAADAATVARALDELTDLPRLMARVFDVEDAIHRAAAALAPTRSHWAVVASGPNQVAAEEVRIKLSELCYKSISVDTVENKKHIDLSCEPLMLVFCAGNPEAVLNDVVKDVAIFKAHKSLPVVFAPEGERRFDPYAAAVIPVPAASPLPSMALCALAGHLFGYHAARAIDDNGRFLSGVRAHLVDAIQSPSARDELPATLAPARREFLDRLQRNRFTSSLHPVTAVRLATLFDLATGAAVPTPEAEALVGAVDGDVVAAFVNVLGGALDECARPVDAIKHQAKIVTVGTSRPEEAMRGVVADALAEAGIDQESLVPVDLLDLRRIQPAVRAVAGLTRYEIAGLRGDGSPDERTTVRVVDRRGVAATLRSRALAGAPLTGTKRQVAADRRIFLGVGRGDGRRIAILPMLGPERHVSGLVLLHLEFQTEVTRAEKLEMLAPKLERFRAVVTEANRPFEPSLVDRLTPEQIVLDDADDLAERVLGAG